MIPVFVKYIMVIIFVFHITQCAVRIVHSHDMVFAKWYPFDATVSPAYELVNLSQVTFKMNLLSSEMYRHFHNSRIFKSDVMKLRT
jgi:hypothetical protein